jgi:aminopeptidase N
VIPVAVGLLGPNGDEVRATEVLELTEASQSFTFTGLAAKPTASVLRDFSAPVILEQDQSNAERAFLLAHDTDAFNRWQAGRSLAEDTLLNMIRSDAAPDADYLDGLLAVLRDGDLDPAYRALVLGLPTQSELAAALHEKGDTPDPMAIWTAVETLRQVTAQHVQDLLPRLHSETVIDAPYSPDADQSGKRALGGAALALTSRLDGGAKAAEEYKAADNMTLQLTALSCLLRAGKGQAELAAFYDQWQHDRLVMDKWFGLQVSMAAPDATADVARKLTEHPDFNWKNPNRFRAVMGALAMNHAGFHRADGKGYALLADWLIKLDPVNPQTTARMCSAFQTWKRYDTDRQALIRTQLTRIADTPDLSRDTTEMVSRILGA